jgi:hypothetical protein
MAHPAHGLFLIAAFLRIPGISRSLSHDEIYTWVIFASGPLVDIFTSYDLPNNHILHTLFVRATAAVFGDAEWSYGCRRCWQAYSACLSCLV